MKFYMYGRTPREKTPKWITVFLISFFVCHAAFFFMVGIVISIDAKTILPFLITFFCIVLFVFLISPICYNMNHAYIEIESEEIKVIEYPFFKKREKIVLLHDIKKVKLRSGGRGRLPYLVFKDDKNKNLFHLDYVPEAIEFVEKIGFQIEH